MSEKIKIKRDYAFILYLALCVGFIAMAIRTQESGFFWSGAFSFFAGFWGVWLVIFCFSRIVRFVKDHFEFYE
jgi:hypothetical protein